MTQIAVIGAGSVVFTHQLLSDLLRLEGLPRLRLVLQDIDPGRLEVARGTAEQVAARLGRPLEVVATADRRVALDGADFVVTMFQVGGIDATRADLELPARHGLRQITRDTTGVGGVFRALRTFPVLTEIAADVRELCPDAWWLNDTNPMTMTIWWLSVVAPDLKVVGLCHSVYETARDLCELVGVPLDGTRCRAGGVNHQEQIWSLCDELTEAHADLLPPELGGRRAPVG